MATQLLINLSNHPYEQWCENQRSAAIKYGEVVDIPFPPVDEKEDEIYIKHLAHGLLDNILQYAKTNNITVHVMGELTLSFLLVNMLAKHNIQCIASTSKRIIKSTSPGIKNEVIFKFERFRKYILNE